MAKTNLKEDKKEEIDLTKVKEELTDYIDLQIKKSFKEELERTYNKIIREKKRRLFFKNIIILILLCVIIFLLYILYTNNYFNKYFEDKPVISAPLKDKENEKENTEEKEDTIIQKPTLDELIKEYEYLLEDIIINEESSYLKDYYNGNLTDELKNYLAFNLIDFSNLSKEDDNQIIESNILESSYSKIFNDKYQSISFDYNGVKIKYIKVLNAYLTDKIITKEESNIQREIIDIKVNNNMVEITTIEGLIKDNKLYNLLTKNEIKKYTKNSKLKNYEDKLNKVIYTFNNEKLESISK